MVGREGWSLWEEARGCPVLSTGAPAGSDRPIRGHSWALQPSVWCLWERYLRRRTTQRWRNVKARWAGGISWQSWWSPWRAFRLWRIHARMGTFLRGVWPVEDLHRSSRSEYEQEWSGRKVQETELVGRRLSPASCASLKRLSAACSSKKVGRD